MRIECAHLLGVVADQFLNRSLRNSSILEEADRAAGVPGGIGAEVLKSGLKEGRPWLVRLPIKGLACGGAIVEVEAAEVMADRMVAAVAIEPTTFPA